MVDMVVSGIVHSRSTCVPAKRSVCAVSRGDPPVVLASGESNQTTGEYTLTFPECPEATIIILGDGNEPPQLRRIIAV
jgi:hypothetical protein